MKTYTLKEIKKAWSNAYNEDIKTEYKGFITLLKQQKRKIKMIKNKRIKSLTYHPISKYWTLNDKYEIDNLGTVYWSWTYVGKRGDFPQYVFEIAEQLKGTFYYKFNKQ